MRPLKIKRFVSLNCIGCGFSAPDDQSLYNVTFERLGWNLLVALSTKAIRKEKNRLMCGDWDAGESSLGFVLWGEAVLGRPCA